MSLPGALAGPRRPCRRHPCCPLRPISHGPNLGPPGLAPWGKLQALAEAPASLGQAAAAAGAAPAPQQPRPQLHTPGPLRGTLGPCGSRLFTPPGPARARAPAGLPLEPADRGGRLEGQPRRVGLARVLHGPVAADRLVRVARDQARPRDVVGARVHPSLALEAARLHDGLHLLVAVAARVVPEPAQGGCTGRGPGGGGVGVLSLSGGAAGAHTHGVRARQAGRAHQRLPSSPPLAITPSSLMASVLTIALGGRGLVRRGVWVFRWGRAAPGPAPAATHSHVAAGSAGALSEAPRGAARRDAPTPALRTPDKAPSPHRC
jgi:hypothetical protein